MHIHRLKILRDIPGLATYNGNPCVFVRYIDAEDIFQVGKSQNLLKSSFSKAELNDVIYFEEFTGIDAMKRVAIRKQELTMILWSAIYV